MTKSEARKLLRERGSSILKLPQMSVLGQLLEAAFVQRDRVQSTQIEEVPVILTLRLLAEKASLSENTARKHLQTLMDLDLVQERGAKGKRTIYHLNFAPLLDWEKTRTVRQRRLEEERERKNARNRKWRAKKAQQTSMSAIDSYDELVAYAAVDRTGEFQFSR